MDIKRKISLLGVDLVLILLASCNSLSPSEHLLVGAWYTIFNVEEDGGESVLECTTKYLDDKTFVVNGTARYSIKADGIDVTTIIIMDISGKGTWSIYDKILKEQLTSANVKITDVDFSGDDVTNNLEQLNKARESARKNAYFEMVIPLKKELLKETSSRIIKLNDKELVEKDDDGNTSEHKRVDDE